MFSLQESPTGSDLKDTFYNDFFNLTFTYRTTADVYRPYGAFMHKDSNRKVTPDEWKNPDERLSDENSHPSYALNLTKFDARKKDIAWIVSHCITESHREDYVNTLKNTSKSLNIDIYGECGDLQVPEKPNIHAGYQQLAKEYKFYLSFENSQCSEYVTEKFFLAIKYGLIPIVNGGLTKSDYSKIAPPKSFLHIDDYEKPGDLMQELRRLSEDREAYESYFWWRDFYEVQTDFDLETQCQLCDIINDDSFESINDYSNLDTYWNTCRVI